MYPIPGEPSERERLLHEATHLPYRNWCKYCLIGRARSHPHASVDHSEDTIPVVSMDYFFLGATPDGHLSASKRGELRETEGDGDRQRD